ncbi:MAG: hypothetical protein R2724_05005 [Bryobacterales bacterium]
MLLLNELLDAPAAEDAPVHVVSVSSGMSAAMSALVSAISVRPHDVATVEKPNGTTVSFAGLIRARNIDTEALPTYEIVNFTTRFPAEQWTTLRANPQAYLQLYQAFQLTPGRYQWDLALHDRLSGKMSVYRTQVDVPDLSGPSTVGPLYLGVLRGGPHPRLVTLLADRSSEAPPDDIYLQGDRIAAQLALYQPTEEEALSRGGGPRTAPALPCREGTARDRL